MNPQTTLGVDDIQLTDQEFWGLPREDREGAFALLRAERPIAWMKELDNRLFEPGPGFWAVTKHADILEISRNPETYCSGRGAVSIADMPPAFLEYFGSLINTDDPKHKRLRGLISAGFTARQLAKLDESVLKMANQTIDEMIEKGEGDFVTDIAVPFPIRVICDIVGIPESQHQFVFDATNSILGAGDPEYVTPGKDIGQVIMGAAVGLVELMKDLRKHRLQNPTGDLTSVLVHAEIDGERLTEQELGSFFILLATAGNDTTRTALGHGMHVLGENPDQMKIWQSDFEAIAPTAVEEIIRWGTPVIQMRRTATRETELRGQKISKGDKLIMWYNSGNRDEDVFDDPFKFDVKRDPNLHVGFGGPGPHYCLGANLARREMTVMFRELFKRIPDIHTTGNPEYLLSLFINGIKHLPVAWTPKK